MSENYERKVEELLDQLQDMKFKEIHNQMVVVIGDLKDIKNDISTDRKRLDRLVIHHENCPGIVNNDITKLRAETKGVRAIEYLFVTYPKVMWLMLVTFIAGIIGTLPVGLEKIFELFTS